MNIDRSKKNKQPEITTVRGEQELIKTLLITAAKNPYLAIILFFFLAGGTGGGFLAGKFGTDSAIVTRIAELEDHKQKMEQFEAENRFQTPAQKELQIISKFVELKRELKDDIVTDIELKVRQILDEYYHRGNETLSKGE